MKKIKSFFFALLTISSLIFFSACPKTPTTPAAPNSPVDDAAQVIASVSGIITDENNLPLQGVTVTSGTATATTTIFGGFSFNNISLSKSNGSITAVKAGYFKGVRSFLTKAGNQHQVRLQLMSKGTASNINAATGGIVTTNGGATINFPAAAFVTSSGMVYTGTVKVFSRWIDPTANNLPFIIPGDLRGVNTNGTESLLETYGMLGAELEDASGNVLKIAPGKNAIINFPIPTNLMASAPATIPLWHFDNATARWKEDGTATKSGSIYIAQVSKFSFWNCDAPFPIIKLDFTLVTGTSNSPLASTSTRIKRISTGTYSSNCITNGVGYAAGLIPKNEALTLEVIGLCGNVVYSQNIGPFAADVSLGNVSITIPPSQVITFTGTIQNCASAPVTSGYINLYSAGGFSTNMPVNASGAFTVSVLSCTTGTNNFSYSGVDITNNQQSNATTVSATSGNINLGTITACGTTALNEYINIVVNGVPESYKFGTAMTQGPILSFPPYTHILTKASWQNVIATGSRGCYLNFYNYNNLTNGLLEDILLYSDVSVGTSAIYLFYSRGAGIPNVPVSFTQFGTASGTFIEGSFSAPGFNVSSGLTQIINCSFKLKQP